MQASVTTTTQEGESSKQQKALATSEVIGVWYSLIQSVTTPQQQHNRTTTFISNTLTIVVLNSLGLVIIEDCVV